MASCIAWKGSQLKIATWFAFAVILSFLTSCASTQEIATTTYAEPPTSSSALVYVYRVGSMPTKANIQIVIDGQPLAWLPDNRFTWFKIPAGAHSISAGYPGVIKSYATLNVAFNPGERHVFQYSGSARSEFSLFGDHAEIEGLTRQGPGWIRLEKRPSSEVTRVVDSLPYVVAKPEIQ